MALSGWLSHHDGEVGEGGAPSGLRRAYSASTVGPIPRGADAEGPRPSDGPLRPRRLVRTVGIPQDDARFAHPSARPVWRCLALSVGFPWALLVLRTPVSCTPRCVPSTAFGSMPIGVERGLRKSAAGGPAAWCAGPPARCRSPGRAASAARSPADTRPSRRSRSRSTPRARRSAAQFRLASVLPTAAWAAALAAWREPTPGNAGARTRRHAGRRTARRQTRPTQRSQAPGQRAAGQARAPRRPAVPAAGALRFRSGCEPRPTRTALGARARTRPGSTFAAC